MKQKTIWTNYSWHINKLLLILFFPLLCSFNCYSQDFSKNSLLGGVGLGLSNNSKTDGFGINWTIGYQRDIWNNKLRISPCVSFGAYTSKGTDDAPDTYFNSTNMKLNLNFDLFKIKKLSLFIGSGFTINYSSGLLGLGGDPGRDRSSYFDETNFAFNGLIGFRLNPKQNRIAYELLLLDGSFSNKEYFSELTVMRIRIMMKLK